MYGGSVHPHLVTRCFCLVNMEVEIYRYAAISFRKASSAQWKEVGDLFLQRLPHRTSCFWTSLPWCDSQKQLGAPYGLQIPGLMSSTANNSLLHSFFGTSSFCRCQIAEIWSSVNRPYLSSCGEIEVGGLSQFSCAPKHATRTSAPLHARRQSSFLLSTKNLALLSWFVNSVTEAALSPNSLSGNHSISLVPISFVPPAESTPSSWIIRGLSLEMPTSVVSWESFHHNLQPILLNLKCLMHSEHRQVASCGGPWA